MKHIWHRLQKSFTSPFWVISFPYTWLILFFLIPFLIVLKISFSDLKLGLPPYGSLTEWLDDGVLIIKLNLTNYGFIGTDSLYLFTYLDSLLIAIIGTIACLCIGYPMAYGIAKATPSLRTILLMMVILPFWTSFLLRVYAWIGILSPQGFLNTALIKIGIISAPLPLLDTTFATILGITYCYLPFMILPLFSSLEKIDHALVEGAVATDFQHRGVDIANLDRGVAACGFIDAEGDVARTACNIKERHMFARTDLADQLILPDTVDPARHQVVHDVVFARNAVENV